MHKRVIILEKSMCKLQNVKQSTGFIDKYVSAMYNKSRNKGLGKLKQHQLVFWIEYN